MTEEEAERIKVEEMWAESCYDQPRGKVSMDKKKCTNVKTNQRVIMPSPLSAQEEAQLAVRELQSNEILISSTSVKDKNGTTRMTK